VNTGLVEIRSGETSDFCVILHEPNGERTILVVNTIPSLPPLNPAVEAALGQARLVYTIPLDLNWLLQLAGLTHAGGARLVLDIESSSPMGGTDLLEGLKSADLVFCSQGGLALAAGDSDIAAGAKSILELGQGGRGAYAATQAGASVFSPAFSVPVVDTTGAGDCFHAAFMAGFLQGQPLEECLRFANAAAALSTLQMGARQGLPSRADVTAFLAGFVPNSIRS
jgi:sugar/nucleoside kinase (ribokinase family)